MPAIKYCTGTGIASYGCPVLYKSKTFALFFLCHHFFLSVQQFHIFFHNKTLSIHTVQLLYQVHSIQTQKHHQPHTNTHSFEYNEHAHQTTIGFSNGKARARKSRSKHRRQRFNNASGQSGRASNDTNTSDTARKSRPQGENQASEFSDDASEAGKRTFGSGWTEKETRFGNFGATLRQRPSSKDSTYKTENGSGAYTKQSSPTARWV